MTALLEYILTEYTEKDESKFYATINSVITTHYFQTK